MTQHFYKGILFYHEAAGQGNLYKSLGQVTEHLTQMCDELTLKLSKEEGDIKKFCDELAQSKDDVEYDVFFLLGGDGTVNELINGVAGNNLEVPIGIIPGGTFNDFTKSLNLSPRPPAAAQELLDAKIKAFDVLKVNDTYALNFAGIGMMVQNSENVDSNKKKFLGKFSYIFTTLKVIANPEVYHYSIEADGEEYTGETSMILIANGNFVGGSRIPLEDLSPCDGKMNVFVFKNHNMSLIKDFFQVKDSLSWNDITENIRLITTDRMKLETSPPTKLDIDGEITFDTPAEIQLLKNKVKLLYVDMDV
ncbi:transcriptional regulator [Staphylococcus piscifermentans]|uniref:Putative lipid kinase n=1 Tax=Staphylococcus piscifermentans TaxID=70258 RepID=A0A239U614_9STAP|nr:diacylglycerol kinase family protein [Staphylococcus piscifermentans]RTX83870.1 diacylglycerol kinase family lipid kinase [Staphylococcus piscifermentans]GEP83481.1 putative lipid kinase [Staphylococcus piscifermentans]SNV04524.1 transcriptional regulator [Staphylococcus piscifermentans]